MTKGFSNLNRFVTTITSTSLDFNYVNPICSGVKNIHWVVGGVHHHPLLNTQNHCEKRRKKIGAFQIGHIEIEKVTKFGGIWRPFWGS